MTPERWQHVKDTFHAALERAPNERALFLDEVCRGDDPLRKEIESLIRAYEETGKLIDAPAYEALAELATGGQELAAGETIGRYSIVSSLGKGGMGEVYLAHDGRLRRNVALKLLPGYFAKDSARLRRFEQEARAASALNHPNILTIYEIGETDSKRFIVAEFIDGLTLRQRMAQSPLDRDEALDIAIHVASALVAAHRAKIVHRDIKPENIMVRREDGLVKVLDFGLAKATEKPSATALDPEAATKALANTAPGMVVGTVAYMSPEQARGVTVDERTDIWSVGVVLYEMIAGKVPFAGTGANEIISQILSKEQPAPLTRFTHDLPAELERIVTKALRKEREQRYQTIQDLMLDLQSLKQQLEFDAKLQRSLPPELKSATAVPTDPAIAETATQPTAHSTLRSGLLTRPQKLRRRSVILAVAAVLILLALALGYLLLFRKGLTTAQPEIKSLAVLPLDNLSGDPAQDYFADGMTEELIASLSKIGNLRVISRASVMQYKGGRKPLMKDIARELNVDAVIEGSVLRSGDRVRITVQLIHGATDRHLWAESYQRDVRDIITLQSEVGLAIANEIRIKLTPQEQGLLTSARPVNPQALDAYLKGRDFFNQGRNKGRPEGPELRKTSIVYFEQAIKIQPDYALAYADLARANHWLGNYPKSKEAALKALQIDETVAEAHGALAYVLVFGDWNWAGAEKEYKRAIELNPSYSEAHWGYSIYLSMVGRHDEAIREINLAEDLDPLTIGLKVGVGNAYLNARQYDRAIEQFRRVVAMEPNYPGAHAELGECYIQKGSYDEGIAELRKGTELSGRDPSKSARLAWAYGVSGNRSEATKILDESLKRLANGGDVLKENIALAYAALGDKDQSFAWLEKAYQDHSDSLLDLKTDPAFDSLRSDPRFADLLRRIGFPQ